MTALAAGLALASALLHVLWNALVRSSEGSLAFVALQLAAGAAVALVFAAAVGRWAVPPAVWPFVAVTVAVHGVYFRALAAAYRHGTLASVYPAARGLGLLITAPAAAWLFGQQLPLATWIGVALVVVGIMAPAASGALDIRARRGVLAVGAAVGLYSLVDSHAVSLVSPAVYISLQFAGAALLILPGSGAMAWARREGLRGVATAAAAGLGSWGSYLLLLYAFQLAPAGPVLALRQVAPALAPAIGARWLAESSARRRWVWSGALLVAAGGAVAAWR